MKKVLFYAVCSLLFLACKNGKDGSTQHGALTDTPVDTTEEIILPDANGGEHSIEQLKGNVVIMDVLLATPDKDSDHMKSLKHVYDKYHSQGLEIYQVCLDTIPERWTAMAKTLPWIAVYDNRTLQSALLEKYSVVNIPSMQLFDRNGKRVNTHVGFSQLDAMVASLVAP